jgi:hypothetical protein
MTPERLGELRVRNCGDLPSVTDPTGEGSSEQGDPKRGRWDPARRLMRFTPWLTDIIAADGPSSMAVENERACERRAKHEFGDCEPHAGHGAEERHVADGRASGDKPLDWASVPD